MQLPENQQRIGKGACRKSFGFTTEFTTNDGKTKQNYAKLCQNTEKNRLNFNKIAAFCIPFKSTLQMGKLAAQSFYSEYEIGEEREMRTENNQTLR